MQKERRAYRIHRGEHPTILKNPKYIGTYIYNDIELEDRIPAIIDKALFDKVQKMLKHNQKNPTPHCEWADYILAGKAFCGLCGDPMTGVSGRGRHGGKYHYYKCNRRKQQNACTKANVQKQWLEDTVIDLTIQKVLTPGMIEFIAESTWQYYLSQREDNAYLASLTAQLAGVEKSIANLIKAIEMGIVNESTKARMDELEAQKQSLKAAIAETKLGSFEITKEHILFFLKQFGEGDIHDEKYRQRIVDTFINSVFVYDDKIVTTYNYSGDNRTLTISDLRNATDGGGFVCRAVRSTRFP